MAHYISEDGRLCSFEAELCPDGSLRPSANNDFVLKKDSAVSYGSTGNAVYNLPDFTAGKTQYRVRKTSTEVTDQRRRKKKKSKKAKSVNPKLLKQWAEEAFRKNRIEEILKKINPSYNIVVRKDDKGYI